MLKKLTTLFITLIFCFLSFSLLILSACGQDEINLTTYDIEIVLEENVIIGKEKVTFYNQTKNAFSELKFNLFANAFRKGAKYEAISSPNKSKAYYNGESFGDIAINAVTNGEKSLDFAICGEDMNILSVSLLDEIFPEEKVDIEIEYKMTLASVIARTGINKSTINLSNFYPILCGIDNGSFYECVYYQNGDPYFSDVANYNVLITLDENFKVASTGKLISSDKYNGKSISKYKANKVRSFCFALSKDYNVVTDNSLGVEINYYYYKDDNPEKGLKTAVESIKYFSEVFGLYPYPVYSVCQTKFIEGGMEYPSIVYISDDLDEKAYSEVIVHETAHQWWQTVVGNNEIEESFLDEGLAEYSVVLFYESHSEYGYSRESLMSSAEKTYKVFCSASNKLFGSVDTTMNRKLCDFESEYEYVNISYIKACIMMDELRKSIGDKKFFNGLKKYYEENMYQNAKTENLISAFVASGVDIQGFFESFIDGKVII